MTCWYNNHAECVETWYALKVLTQTRKSFKAAGGQKMRDLKCYNESASASARGLVAKALAEQLHNMGSPCISVGAKCPGWSGPVVPENTADIPRHPAGGSRSERRVLCGL
jgi:hypothetical protein